MECLGCGSRETVQNQWGNWCDYCGGVVIKSANEKKLFFRHVATVSGAGGRFPVVYDLSAEAYGVSWPRQVVLVTCIHCGQRTPGDDSRSGLTRLDDLKVGYHSRRGSLDAVLASIQPIARGGEEQDFPQVWAAPSATEEEKKVVLG